MDKIEPITIIQNVNDVQKKFHENLNDRESVEENSTMTKFFTLE